MKVLVIGGTGPTGPYIIDGLLKRGYNVSILHRGIHEVTLPPEVEHIHSDPHFEETLKSGLGDRKFDLAIGLYGRLRFVANVLKGRVPRLITVGAGGLYLGWRPPEIPPEDLVIPTPEDAPLQTNPEANLFTYRMTEAENEVMTAHRQGHYSVTHFRYPMIYGPRQLAPYEWCILRRMLDKRKRLIILDGGLAMRSQGYAENMAHGMMLAVDKPKESAGQIYNIRDERLFTFRGWVSLICKIMDYKFEFIEMPYSFARPVRIYHWGHKHLISDITKVKAQLGYCDIVPTEKGLELTLKWLMENRPTSGGEVEQQIRDTFDYTLEDKIIDEFMVAWQRIRKLQPLQLGFQHPYAHPDKPETPPN